MLTNSAFGGTDKAADITDDGTINANDPLGLLSKFGTECTVAIVWHRWWRHGVCMRARRRLWGPGTTSEKLVARTPVKNQS